MAIARPGRAGCIWLIWMAPKTRRTGRSGCLARLSAPLLKVQTGGGIRSRADVAALAQAGASRIVIGSLAVRDPDAVRAMFDEFGPEMICLAADVMWGQPMATRPAITSLFPVGRMRAR